MRPQTGKLSSKGMQGTYEPSEQKQLQILTLWRPWRVAFHITVN